MPTALNKGHFGLKHTAVVTGVHGVTNFTNLNATNPQPFYQTKQLLERSGGLNSLFKYAGAGCESFATLADLRHWKKWNQNIITVLR